MSESCSFFSAASDGHKYIWAIGHHPGSNGGQHIAAFDIDSGDHAGDHSTCNTPIDLEYLPSRREMWVRCAQRDRWTEGAGEIDVFSSDAISADHKQIHLNTTSRPYGRMAIHSDMGPYGYGTSYNQGVLSEFDLSNKTISGEYTIEKASGGYGMAYSPENSHLFVRTRICCSCGNDDSDLKECGGYSGTASSVLVQTGPDASPNKQNGTCGTGCLGSRADTLGVAEFDTVGKKFVANHGIMVGTGFGSEPFASPDGKYILLMPNDGGKYVRVMRPGENGVPSVSMRFSIVFFHN